MIKTYSDGSQGFDLSDLSRPENTEFIKNTIKNSMQDSEILLYLKH